MLHRKKNQTIQQTAHLIPLRHSFQLNYHRGLQLGKAKTLKNLMALHAQGLAAFTSKSESYWKHESINKYDTTNYGTREFLLACVAQIKKKKNQYFSWFREDRTHTLQGG